MPPNDGPSMLPIADIVPSRLIARQSRALGTTSPTKAIVSAIITAAPNPCMPGSRSGAATLRFYEQRGLIESLGRRGLRHTFNTDIIGDCH